MAETVLAAHGATLTELAEEEAVGEELEFSSVECVQEHI